MAVLNLRAGVRNPTHSLKVSNFFVLRAHARKSPAFTGNHKVSYIKSSGDFLSIYICKTTFADQTLISTIAVYRLQVGTALLYSVRLQAATFLLGLALPNTDQALEALIPMPDLSSLPFPSVLGSIKNLEKIIIQTNFLEILSLLL